MELVFTSILALIAFGLFLRTFQFGGIVVSTDTIGPAGFPQFVLVATLVLLVLIARRNILARKASSTTAAPAAPAAKTDLRAVGSAVALLALYIAVLQYLGFVISTFLFSVVSIRNLGYRSLRNNLIFTFILTAGITLVFGRLFYVPLPRGIGILRQLSYLAY